MDTNENKQKKDKSLLGIVLAIVIGVAFLVVNELTWIRYSDNETSRYAKTIICAIVAFLVGRYVYKLTQDD